jgi:hypothetical protein
MEANVELSPNQLAAIFGPDKYKEELWPLILPVVKRVSAHPRLRAEINTLFNNIDLQENNEVARNEFKTALKALQDKVMEIKIRNDTKVPNELEKLREKQAIFPEMALAQGGRRRTKNAYFYNKRRKTRRRKGKK